MCCAGKLHTEFTNAAAWHKRHALSMLCAGKLHPEFMNAAAWHSYALIGSFQPQSVANMIWAYAKLAHRPPPAFLDVLCRHALQQLASFSPQNISNTIWALATLKHTDQVGFEYIWRPESRYDCQASFV